MSRAATGAKTGTVMAAMVTNACTLSVAASARETVRVGLLLMRTRASA